MIFDFPNWLIALLNGFGVPILHLSISWLVTQLPLKFLFPSCNLYNSFLGEQWLWERVFQVRSWKKLLPDAGPWFGGEGKGKLRSSQPQYLREFAQETKRGELAHWLQLVAICGLMLWTPTPWAWLIFAYAWLSNLPCILSLRHTRLRLEKILKLKGNL